MGLKKIVSIYLLPQYYGKGLGNKLLKSAVLDLKKSGYKSIYLWVLKDNHRAKRFYEKNGFHYNNDECVCEIMGEQLTELRYVYSFK